MEVAKPADPLGRPHVHAHHLDPMVDDLEALPKKTGAPILTAWNETEDLLDLLALTGTTSNRTTIAHRVFWLY